MWLDNMDMADDPIYGCREIIVIPKKDYSVWKTSNQSTIPITEMTTSHIKNCIKLIVRRNGWREGYLQFLVKELINRNEL